MQRTSQSECVAVAPNRSRNATIVVRRPAFREQNLDRFYILRRTGRDFRGFGRGSLDRPHLRASHDPRGPAPRWSDRDARRDQVERGRGGPFRFDDHCGRGRIPRLPFAWIGVRSKGGGRWCRRGHGPCRDQRLLRAEPARGRDDIQSFYVGPEGGRPSWSDRSRILGQRAHIGRGFEWRARAQREPPPVRQACHQGH